MGAYKYGHVEVEWTEEKTKKVKELLMKYFNEYEGYFGETIMQDDDCQIYAPVTMAKIADILFEGIEIE